MQTPPPIPNAPKTDWWERNWKWCVPVIVAVAIAGFTGAFVGIVGIVKSSDAYQEAVQRSRSSPAVVAALGTPIEEGFFVAGSVSSGGGSGRANLAIPISGPKGTATLYVNATKTNREWHFNRLLVQMNQTQQRIDLLEKPISAHVAQPIRPEAPHG